MYIFGKEKNEQAISPETQSPGTGCADGEEKTMGESLAMVYSPRQYWRDTYSPVEALDHGTLFAELDKPLTGVCIPGGGDCK